MDRLVARLALAAGGLLIIAILVIAAIVCLCAALYLALLAWLTPSTAALVTAASVLAASGVVAVIVVLAVRAKQKANEPLGKRLSRELTSLASQHTTGAVAAALLAGFAVGAVPPLRDALKDVLAK
jgi:amino acid transporter